MTDVSQKRVARWLGISTAGKLFSQAVSWITTIYVMRWLTPTDYGLSATVFSFLSIASIFIEYSLINQLVRSNSSNKVRRYYYQGFCLAISLTLAILLGLIGILYGQRPEGKPLQYGFFLGAAFILPAAIRVSSEATLLKNFRFSTQLKISIISAILGSLTTLAMTIGKFGYFALITGPLTSILSTSILSHVFSGNHFRPKFQKNKFRSILRTSKQIYISELYVHLGSFITVFLWSLNLTTANLGLITTAIYWASTPVGKSMNIINPVALPIFSNTSRAEPEKLSAAIISSLRILIIINSLIFGYLFAASPYIIEIIFGAAWREITPLFAAICTAMPLRACQAFLINPLRAISRDKEIAYIQASYSGITIASALLGLHLEIGPLAQVYSFGIIVASVICIIRSAIALNLPLKTITLTALQSSAPGIVASIVCTVQFGTNIDANFSVLGKITLLYALSFLVLLALSYLPATLSFLGYRTYRRQDPK
jgi:O-antigen/teichoic acid export membrane protein